VGEAREVVVGGLQRRVDGVEREVAEPRLRAVPVDEGRGFAPEGVGEVVEFGDRGRVAENGIADVARGVEEVVLAAEEAEVFVEPALELLKLRRIAQVRFADPTGRVAGGLEAVAEGLLRYGKTYLRIEPRWCRGGSPACRD